jgi:hypothetical protein
MDKEWTKNVLDAIGHKMYPRYIKCPLEIRMAERKQFKINLPQDVKDWLTQQADQNLRSQSSELILALREKMSREIKGADATSWPVSPSTSRKGA